MIFEKIATLAETQFPQMTLRPEITMNRSIDAKLEDLQHRLRALEQRNPKQVAIARAGLGEIAAIINRAHVGLDQLDRELKRIEAGS